MGIIPSLSHVIFIRKAITILPLAGPRRDQGNEKKKKN